MTCSYGHVFAGGIDVEWLSDSISLGKIPEDGGKVSAKFKFVNRGRKAIKIDKVVVSCGCTEAEYTHGKINKGDTAFLTLIYDPEDRMGHFQRTTLVYFEKQSIPYRLLISGDVIPSHETLSLLYPFSENNIYFDRLNLDFGEITRRIRRRNFIEIYNGSDNPFKPVFTADSEGLTWVLEPEEINSGDKGLLTIYLDSAKIVGFGKRDFTIRCDVGVGKEAVIRVSADIKVN